MILKKSLQADGKIVKEKRAIPIVGWLAFFIDVEGIVHGILQLDKKAK